MPAVSETPSQAVSLSWGEGSGRPPAPPSTSGGDLKENVCLTEVSEGRWQVRHGWALGVMSKEVTGDSRDFIGVAGESWVH